MALIIFIIILSILVLVHEFGHFIVAKKFGIRVEEFGLGIPPRMIGKQIGETLYSLNWLPFGGFVKVTGEDPADVENATTSALDPKSFASKGPFKRISVLAAGVFMNLVLAVIVFYFVLAHFNYRTQYIPLLFDHKFKFGSENVLGTVVTSLMKDSAAEKAGIQLGEDIVSVDGIPVNNVLELRESLKGKLGQTVTVELKDIKTGIDGPTRTIQSATQSDDAGHVVLGVYVTKAVSISYSSHNERRFAGFLHAYNVIDFSAKSFGKLIGLSVEEKSITPVSQSVSGPVGIYDLVSGLLKYGGDTVVYQLLDFLAIMSLSLAMLNILPIPALDGGRIFFVLLEMILGKPVSAKIETTAHKFGFTLLIGLLLVITFKDIFLK